jgi:preprotein translocase subunit YajC
MFFILLILFFVASFFGIRWLIQRNKKANSKAQQDLAYANDLFYGDSVELTPTTVGVIEIIQQMAKENPVVIERVLEWTDTIKNPLKANILKLLYLSLK